MQDLLLDSISEKLSAIDQKATEIVKVTGETNRSIDQIRSRLSALESIKNSTIGEIQPPQRPESNGNRPLWLLASQNKLRHIIIPILTALIAMVALSFVLTAGIRTSLLLPYLLLTSPKNSISPSLTKPTTEEPIIRQTKKNKRATGFKGTLIHFYDSVRAPHP